MIWKVSASKLNGTLIIPPSKSHTIRAILVATLAEGVSTLRNVLVDGDGRSALAAASALGATVEQKDKTVVITGIGAHRDRGYDLIYTGNSGTSTNLFCGAAALGSRPRTFDGDSSLRSRPMKPLLSALMQLGANVTYAAKDHDVPFTLSGPIKGGRVTVSGLNSQYVSSLLFASPLLDQSTEIIVENLHEKPYIGITLWWLDRLGIRYTASPEWNRFTIPGAQHYAPINHTIASDFSSATFGAVAAAITGSQLTLSGVDFTDPQGDKGVFDLLAEMGAMVDKKESSAIVTGLKRLVGRTIDLNAMPDALPAMAVAACAAQGETRVVNVAQARIKETDRIAVMATELKKMGADISERPDGLVIRGADLHGAEVDGHDDHRVVMALALAGMITDGETTITGAEAASVTYPDFANDFLAVGAKIQVIGKN